MEEDTHLYLEVFGAAVPGLSFRGNFFAGVRLLTVSEGELPLETPAFETDAGETAEGFSVGKDVELLCVDPTSPTFWLFIQVNLDFFKYDVLCWAEAGPREGGFATLN